MTGLRVLLHDYPGHAFPVQLARSLAARGHEVLHLHCASFSSPRGPLAPAPDDPPSLTLEALSLGGAVQKYDFITRWRQERAYGRQLVERVAAWRPDVVLGGNASIDPQAALQAWARKHRVGFLYWLQDVHGIAITAILARKLGPIGRVIGKVYTARERELWRRSDVVVAITEDFRAILTDASVAADRIAIVQNWADLEDLAPRPKDNAFARAHGLHDKTVLLYSGTMGLKHNPERMVELARAFRTRPEVRIVVVSEGIGADHIAAAKAAEGLDNLIVLPFQPYTVLPDLVGSGDILCVLLEPEAGIYSVPSKLLTYCCAGRAVLGAIPAENLASRIIERNGIGQSVDPSDGAGFVAAAEALVADAPARIAMGSAARLYAEATFDITTITDGFERLLTEARDRGRG